MNTRYIPAGANLLPEHATKVFEGVLFDVYQWPQAMFDGSTQTFEMLKRPDTVLVAAFNDDGDMLALREEQPGMPVREMRMPGGRVDVDDAELLAAAQRELHEETGLVMREWYHLETVQPEAKIDWLIHVFGARGVVQQDEAHHDTDGERIEARWVSYGDFREHNVDNGRISVFRKHATIEELFAGKTEVKIDIK